MERKSNLHKRITATLIAILGTITIIWATPYNLNDKNEDSYDMGNNTPIICPNCSFTGWKAYGKQVGDTLFVKRIECKMCFYEQEYITKIKTQ